MDARLGTVRLELEPRRLPAHREETTVWPRLQLLQRLTLSVHQFLMAGVRTLEPRDDDVAIHDVLGPQAGVPFLRAVRLIHPAANDLSDSQTVQKHHEQHQVVTFGILAGDRQQRIELFTAKSFHKPSLANAGRAVKHKVRRLCLFPRPSYSNDSEGFLGRNAPICFSHTNLLIP